ncbi:MAG: RluA family pseudouridine synthase [Candidatus Marinimicrobia bacterium]|nr:RluA family pseudouridine synthase [Candidatus Neomarinimicrobiota bacterium]
MPIKRFEIGPGAAGPLREVLARQLGCSGRVAKALLDRRAVLLNGRRIWMARHPVPVGALLEVQDLAPGADDQPARIPILWRQGAALVVNKPPGLVTTGPDSLETCLQRQLNCPELTAVHRLDRDTTGCLLCACDAATRIRLVAAFSEQSVTKMYHALVRGVPPDKTFVITRKIQNQSACTRARVLAAGDNAAHLQLDLRTGRTHQIRIHLEQIGHPVLGDKQYLTGKLDPRWRALPRHMLHAERLVFPQPDGNGRVVVRAPLPPDFRQAMKRLGLR